MLRAINRTIVSVVRLVSNLVLMIPNLFFKRKKALAVFKAELKAHGIDEKTAQEFTKSYKQLGDFKQWIGTTKK